MKNIKLLTIVFSISLFLIGCSTNNKILDLIELGKTTRNEVSELELKMDTQKIYNPDKGVCEFIYISDYSEYILNNVDGTIYIFFNIYNDTAQSLYFSAEATSENMNQLLSYLIDTYGENYEKVEEYTTRWTSGNLIIDYVLTDEGTIEVRWYK